MNNQMKLSTADMVLGVGLILAVIFTFFPWYGVSFSCSSDLGPYCSSLSNSVSGFHSWGILYFFVALVLLAYLALRVFAASTVSIPALPLQDWLMYLIGAAIMVVSILLFLASSPGGQSGPGYSTGVSFGFFLALAAAVATAIGAYLKRSDPQPATQPMNRGYPTTPTAPPPPPAPPYTPPTAPPPSAGPPAQ